MGVIERDHLSGLVHEVTDMLHSAVSQQDLQDAEVRRLLSFLSNVIQVVEQAFNPVLAVLIDIQYLDPATISHSTLLELRKRLELLTAQSYFHDAAEICSRLRHLGENYRDHIEPLVANLPESAQWMEVLSLLEEHEGRLIRMIYDAVHELKQLLEKADSGSMVDLEAASEAAKDSANDLRTLLQQMHDLNGRILGVSGRAGFLELTRNRDELQREVNLVIDNRDQSSGHRVTINNEGTIAGNIVVADVIKNSFNAAAAAPNNELKQQLQTLTQEVEKLLANAPADKAEEVAGDLDVFVKEAAKEQPRRKWYEVSAEGLIDAATALGGLVSPVIPIVRNVLKLLG